MVLPQPTISRPSNETHLSLTDIEGLARRALDGECGLDALVREALYGSARAAPKLWGEWSVSEVEAWDLAVETYLRMKREDPGVARQPYARVKDATDLHETWSGIESVSAAIEGPHAWFELPWIGWTSLAQFHRAGTKSTQYLYRALGWRMSGCYSTRRIVLAPCVACGVVYEAESFKGRLAECCQQK